MDTTIESLRAFNRAWTEVLGLLDQGVLQTEYSLIEARMLFELAQHPTWERLALRRRLGMDASYLTRVLGRLQRRGLVTATPSAADGRALDLSLTEEGRAAFEDLDRRSVAQLRGWLAPLTNEQRCRVAETTGLISQLVQPATTPRRIALRGLQPGDMGWVIERHGAIYFDEYGWNADFEAVVAQIVATYHAEYQQGRNAAWVATVDGVRAGCVFCCRKDDSTAQLRILLVEPWARGLGLGTQLVEQCIDFATGAGYGSIVLWTNDVLVSARRIYEAAGFTLTDSDPHNSFGHDLVGQYWARQLP